MRLLNKVLLIACVALSSCSAYYHTKQAKKHAEKAIYKDPAITVFDGQDSTIFVKGDSIVTIDTLDNYITKTIRTTDTLIKEVIKYDFSKVKTRQDKRLEFRLQKKISKLQAQNERLRLRLEAKNERQKVRQEQKTERVKERKSNWIIFLIVGLIVGFVLGLYLRSLLKR